jgi:hypothetical protein
MPAGVPGGNGALGIVVAGVLSALVIGTAVHFVVDRSSSSESTPTSPAGMSAKGDSGAAATGADAGRPLADVELSPITLVWHGHVKSATGEKALAAGAPCTLTEIVVHGTAWDDYRIRSVVFQCGIHTLYDSTIPLVGMASTSDMVEEIPVAGDVLAFQYATKHQDVGTRSGERNQINLDTRNDSVEAFRQIAPEFQVKASIDELTAVRRGKALLDVHVPTFMGIVRREAKITSRSGPVPFTASSCDLAISSAGSGDENCRVLLTCGGKELFGGGTASWEKCTMAGGEPVSLNDSQPTPKDHDPELSVDLPGGQATLGDVLPNGAQYTVNFTLHPK